MHANKEVLTANQLSSAEDNILSPRPAGRVTILTSGGIDSTACIPYYRTKGFSVTGLFVDYGQLASSKEEAAAAAICSHYEIPLQRIVVTGYENISSGYVVGRNAFLLHVALMAFEHPAGIIALGIHSGTGYVDCTEDFLRHMQTSFDIYVDGRIRVDAPFLNWNKREIWEFCRKSGAPLKLTYSCENGVEQPCGKCASCRDLEALYAG